MTQAQRETLEALCRRYNVTFNEEDYKPSFDLPTGYVAGWIGGNDHGYADGGVHVSTTTIYVGVALDGQASS